MTATGEARDIRLCGALTGEPHPAAFPEGTCRDRASRLLLPLSVAAAGPELPARVNHPLRMLRFAATNQLCQLPEVAVAGSTRDGAFGSPSQMPCPGYLSRRLIMTAVSTLCRRYWKSTGLAR